MTKCSELSERDPSLPIDTDEVKSSVMFYLEGVTSEQLPDTTLDLIINKAISSFEDNQTYTCDVIYITLLESLKYLIRKSWVDQGENSVGLLKKIKDKEDQVDREIEYESFDGQKAESGWEKIYNYFLKNPEDICPCLKYENNSEFGLIAIGGTQQDKYVKNEWAPNSRTLWDRTSLGSKFSYRRECRRRRSNNRSKYWR